MSTIKVDKIQGSFLPMPEIGNFITRETYVATEGQTQFNLQNIFQGDTIFVYLESTEISATISSTQVATISGGIPTAGQKVHFYKANVEQTFNESNSSEGKQYDLRSDLDSVTGTERQMVIVTEDTDANNGPWVWISGTWVQKTDLNKKRTISLQTYFENALIGLSLSPYLSFDDNIEFGITDKNGFKLDSDILLELINNSPKSFVAPYSSFDDQDSYVEIDRNGKILSNNTSQLIKVPFSSFDDMVQYVEVDRGGYILVQGSAPEPEVPVVQWENPLYIDYTNSNKRLLTHWLHDKNIMLRMEWMPNGHNSLFNFKSIYRAIPGDPDKADWVYITSSGTDYVPPITHNATGAGGPISSNVGTTGGNHGGKNGEITAWMRTCEFFLDDRIKMEANYKGYNKSVLVKWMNEICAGNTVTQQRVTTRQEMQGRFTKRNVELQSKVTALEQIRIYREGGPQLVGTGWEDSYHFYGGVQQGPVPYNVTSGTLSARVAASTQVAGTSVSGRGIKVYNGSVDEANLISDVVTESDGIFRAPLDPPAFYNDILIVQEFNGATKTNEVSIQFVADGGSFAEAPDSWAVVLKDKELGYEAAWVDKTWGTAKVADVDKVATRNTGSYKFYIFTSRNEAGTFVMNPGDSYTWRGGYSWAPIDIVDSGLDSAFMFDQNDKTRIAIASTPLNKKGIVKLPEEYISADFEIIGGLDSIGTEIEFSGYAAKPFREEI